MTEIEGARLKIIKAILTEFPELRGKVRTWLEETEKEQKHTPTPHHKDCRN